MSPPIKGRAVLFSEMTPPPGGEDTFNRWYNFHHTPSHVQGVPGFLSARRYKSDAGPHYLAVYDLDSPAALQTAEYKTRKFTPDEPTRAMLASVSGFSRYIGDEFGFAIKPGVSGEPLDAEIVIGVFLALPADRSAEFEEWYESEHTPILLECPDWSMARHFRVVDRNPQPFTHMILHYVRTPAVMESEALKRARATEWRNRLAREPWFKPHVGVYRAFTSRFRKTNP
jgi:hypothetical protein